VELDLAAAHDLFGLPYVIFRPHNVYGEFQNLNDQFRNVVGIFSRQLLLGEPLTIFGDGSQRRAFTYIQDILPSCIACLKNTKSHGQVFNLGSDMPVTVLQLANLLLQISGIPCLVNHLPERHEVIDAFSSHKKAEAFFGSFPKTNLEDGIKKTWAWAKNQKISLRSLPFEVEISQNLPPSWAKLLKP
jgi:UDP-glucose 4-epimerase